MMTSSRGAFRSCHSGAAQEAIATKRKSSRNRVRVIKLAISRSSTDQGSGPPQPESVNPGPNRQYLTMIFRSADRCQSTWIMRPCTPRRTLRTRSAEHTYELQYQMRITYADY